MDNSYDEWEDEHEEWEFSQIQDNLIIPLLGRDKINIKIWPIDTSKNFLKAVNASEEYHRNR